MAQRASSRRRACLASPDRLDSALPSVANSGEPLLSLVGVGKAYPGVIALANLTLSVAKGEVIGLVGENGAGKSTLMKILGGVVAPDSGEIVIDGESRAALSVAQSMK